MGRQLNIRSDEAYSIAHAVAERTGRPVSEVVLEALREYGRNVPVDDGLTATAKANAEAIRAAGRRAATRVRPGASVERIMDDMYDDFGLPK